MKKLYFIFPASLLIMLVLGGEIMTQTRKKRPAIRKKQIAVGSVRQSESVLQCSAQQKSGEKMTYLVGAGKLSSKDKQRIEETWGTLVVPQGETERAKETRQNAVNYKKTLVEALTNSLETWKKANPNASAEQIEEQLFERMNAAHFIAVNPTEHHCARPRDIGSDVNDALER